MKLSESELIQGADRIGKLLQARNISTGSYGDPIPTELDITSVVINSEDNKEKGTHSSKGKLTEFFDMEKDAAKGILAALNYDWTALPEGLKKIHTKNYEAFKDYSAGLDYMDKENYDKAKEAFKKAVDLDPNFRLAKEAFLSIPIAALTIVAVIASGSAAAPAAGTAVTAGVSAAGAAGAGTVGTAAISTGMGTGTALLIGGGVAAVGGGAALALGDKKSGSSGSSTSGSGSSTSSSSACNDPGTNWSGTLNITLICGIQMNTTGSWSGSIDRNCVFNLTGDNTNGKESGSTLSLTKTVGSGNCAGQTVTFSGTISGTSLSGTISGASTGTFVGTKQ